MQMKVMLTIHSAWNTHLHDIDFRFAAITGNKIKENVVCPNKGDDSVLKLSSMIADSSHTDRFFRFPINCPRTNSEAFRI